MIKKNLIPEPIKHIWHFLDTFFESISSGHYYLLASGIAFNVIFCTLPLSLVIVSSLSIVSDEQMIVPLISRWLNDLLPATPQTADVITGVIAEIRQVFEFGSIAGWIGGIALLWTSSALFSSLRTGLNAAFNIPSPRFFLVYKAKDIGLVIGFILLLLLSTLPVTFAGLFQSAGSALTETIFTQAAVTAITTAGNWSISLASTILFFYFLYRWLPNKPPNHKTVVRATLTGTLLWEAARFLFGWYLTTVGGYGKIYGVYAALAGIAVWIYYSALIVIISAKFSVLWEQRQ